MNDWDPIPVLKDIPTLSASLDSLLKVKFLRYVCCFLSLFSCLNMFKLWNRLTQIQLDLGCLGCPPQKKKWQNISKNCLEMPFCGKAPHASPHVVVGLGLEPSQVGQLVSPWWWCGSASAPASAKKVGFSWRPQVASSEIRSERCWKMDEHGWTWMEMEDPAGKWMDSRNESFAIGSVSSRVISCQLTMVGDGWLLVKRIQSQCPPPLYSGRRCPWGNSLRPKHPVRRSKDASGWTPTRLMFSIIWVSNLLFWWVLTNTHFFFPQQRRPLYRSSIGRSGLDEPERCPATVALMCAGPQMMPVIVALLTVKGARVYIDLTQNDMNDSLWESSSFYMFLSTLQIHKNHLI